MGRVWLCSRCETLCALKLLATDPIVTGMSACIRAAAEDAGRPDGLALACQILEDVKKEEKKVTAFKVDFVTSRDFRSKRDDPAVEMTVMHTTVTAEDYDSAILRTHALFHDAVVLATYKQEPTEEGYELMEKL